MKLILSNLQNYLVGELSGVLEAIEDGGINLYIWPEGPLDRENDLIGQVTDIQINWKELQKSVFTVDLDQPHRLVETDGFLLVKVGGMPKDFAIYQEDRGSFDTRMKHV